MYCALTEEAREIDDELAASDTASDLDEGHADDVVADLAMTRSRAAVGLCEQQALSVPKSLAAASSIPRAVPDRRSHASRQALVRPGERRGRWWLAACLLLAAVFAGRAYWEEASLPAVPQPSQAAAQGDAPASQPIETIRVGQRVVASVAGKPAAEAAADTQVDPSSWRLLRLRAEDRWADGTLDVVRIETLQGPEWIATHRATVGATVPLPLDLQEMGLPGSLRAVVTANEPCPPVASGPGRVVLTTVNHLNASVLELALVDGRGRQEQLRPTGSHKFFSEDRQEFVAAEELREGEHLQGIGGRLTLLRADRLPGVHRVYNMTVEGEHVYRVSLLGALVHNNCPMTGDQRAIKELADEATFGGRRPLSTSDANTILDWAQEYNYPGWRAGPGDVGSPSNWTRGGGVPHIHLPGVGSGHVPVQPGVTPRVIAPAASGPANVPPAPPGTT